MTRFHVLTPLTIMPTWHGILTDFRKFWAFFKVRSIRHASTRALIQGFSQGCKVQQAYCGSGRMFVNL